MTATRRRASERGIMAQRSALRQFGAASMSPITYDHVFVTELIKDGDNIRVGPLRHAAGHSTGRGMAVPCRQYRLLRIPASQIWEPLQKPGEGEPTWGGEGRC